VIDEDSEKEKNVLDVAYEDRKRADDESTVDRRIARKLRDKVMRKIYQELHNAVVHKLSSIR
jgi:hypothetical protein